MQPYFRDAVRGDLAEITTILRERDSATAGSTTPQASGAYRDALAEIDRSSGNYVLVAEFDSRIVAVLQLLVFRHLQGHGGSTAQVVSLDVAPSHRTTGIAGMLLDHALGRCRDLGCTRLQTLSSTACSDEHHFWERHGFVQLDRGYARPI